MVSDSKNNSPIDWEKQIGSPPSDRKGAHGAKVGQKDSVESVSVLVPSNKLKKGLPGRFSRTQKVTLLVAAFFLNVFALGSDLSGGILYAKLHSPPCVPSSPETVIRGTSNRSNSLLNGTENDTAELVGTDNRTAMGMHNLTETNPPDLAFVRSGDKTSSSVTQICGGFGHSASQTGEAPMIRHWCLRIFCLFVVVVVLVVVVFFVSRFCDPCLYH